MTTSILERAKATIAAVDKMFEPAFQYDTASGEIWLDGPIGPWADEINANSVRAVLREMGPTKPITIYLNSPGGSVFEGTAIYRELTQHRGKLTTVVASLAASMASILLQAGQERVCDRHGLVMVHNPWTGAIGDAATLEKEVELLRKIETQMVGIYMARTGLGEDAIREMLDNETWLNADEALAAGFVDRLEEEYQPAATWTREQARLAVAACSRGHRPAEDPAFVAAMWPKRAQARRQLAKVDAMLGSVGIDRI